MFSTNPQVVRCTDYEKFAIARKPSTQRYSNLLQSIFDVKKLYSRVKFRKILGSVSRSGNRACP